MGGDRTFAAANGVPGMACFFSPWKEGREVEGVSVGCGGRRREAAGGQESRCQLKMKRPESEQEAAVISHLCVCVPP
ncbi:adropin isoform X1 [Anolis carolinensis]|uniref:adropin isoform X1 n=1 Tax=Anolis carolinensis TaxID=28377 RepID=UPI002F2B4F2E